MGGLPGLDSFETIKACDDSRVCLKRKASDDDYMPCSSVQEPSINRNAVKKFVIVPAKCTKGITREISYIQNKAGGILHSEELSNSSVALHEPPLHLMEVQIFPSWTYISFVESSLSNCRPHSSITCSDSMDHMQMSMDGDTVDSEGKREEDANQKESPTKASDRKESKDTGSSRERDGEDKGESGKDDNGNDKETAENRSGKDEEGDEESKDDENEEKEEEEAEEDENKEEEGKQDFETELDSEFCRASMTQFEQVLDCSTLSDCRSHESDDMYHGQGGLSSQSRYKHLIALASHRPNVDTDMDTCAHSASHFPMSDGSASIEMHHGSPCLQSLSHNTFVNKEATSDVSRDLYSNAMNCSIQRTYSYENPCLRQFPDEAGCQISSDISKDLYADGSASHSWQPTTEASPSVTHSIADAFQQTSSGASRDTMSLDQPCQPEKMDFEAELPTEKTTNIELPSTFEDGTGEEVLSKLKEVKDFPSTAKGLLSSGVLDGCRVYYHYKGSGSTLTGLVKDGGILCNCRLCKGKVVVNVSSFEKHAGSNARHPSDYIFLENGKSLQEIIKAGCQASQGKVSGVVRKAANEGTFDRTGMRNSATRSASGFPRRSSDPSKLETLQSRTSQKQSSQTRDGSRHKLLFQPGGLPDGTEVAYYVKGQCFLRGTKKGHGICCGCCNEVVSCSQFEAHAGWASRRNAYISMYLANGQSLHEYALALAVKDQNLTDSSGLRENDDFCAECGDGGDLVLCDACPKAYHSDCAGLIGIPSGDWCCPLCESKKLSLSKQYAKESGRLLCWNNKEANAQRCHRVVKASENTIGGCVFCKNGDFQKSGFGPKTIMLCDQCEREFHVGCMKEKGIADLKEVPSGEWFCCSDCQHIHNVLEGLVISGPEPVWFSSALRKQKVGITTGVQSCEVTWQLLHGRRGNPANGRMLAEAASIFTESFDPIADATSGRDLISLMVYSRTIRDQDFQGMYCAVLKQREIVISAAVFRVFGRQFAEMPLVATASAHRGQGYFQLLMSCIEGLLHLLQVKYLILPAAEGAEGIWTNKFGFSKLPETQSQQFGSEVQMMTFQGSSMLFKAIV